MVEYCGINCTGIVCKCCTYTDIWFLYHNSRVSIFYQLLSTFVTYRKPRVIYFCQSFADQELSTLVTHLQTKSYVVIHLQTKSYLPLSLICKSRVIYLCHSSVDQELSTSTIYRQRVIYLCQSSIGKCYLPLSVINRYMISELSTFVSHQLVYVIRVIYLCHSSIIIYYQSYLPLSFIISYLHLSVINQFIYPVILWKLHLTLSNNTVVQTIQICDR